MENIKINENKEKECAGCVYFGRAADAPESAPMDCMWKMVKDESDSDAPPCEEE